VTKNIFFNLKSKASKFEKVMQMILYLQHLRGMSVFKESFSVIKLFYNYFSFN